MSGVFIRDAGRIDLDSLSALEARTFVSDRISRRSFSRLIGAGTARLRVAEMRSGGCVTILGYHLVLFRKGSRVARLYSIAVDRRSRGKGLGDRLLDDAEAIASGARKGALRLEVRPRNRPAIALYERRGYRPFGRLRAYYADHADALRYEKMLIAMRPRPDRRGTWRSSRKA
jgi:ribosomal protein S18 acetylase RimI-like enzyme